MDRPCCVGVVRDSAGLVGTEIEDPSVKLYSSSPSARNGTNMGVVVVHDVFGFALPNGKYIADHFASLGYEAVLPDFYEAQGIAPWPATEADISAPTEGDAFGAFWGSITSEAFWDTFDAQLAAAVGILQTRGCTKFAIMGFCWGGIAAERAAQTETFAAAVSAHGCMHDAESYRKCKANILYMSVPDDAFFAKESQDEIAAAGGQVKIFEGMHHGFVVRGDFAGDSGVKAAADEAMADADALFRSVGQQVVNTQPGMQQVTQRQQVVYMQPQEGQQMVYAASPVPAPASPQRLFAASEVAPASASPQRVTVSSEIFAKLAQGTPLTPHEQAQLSGQADAQPGTSTSIAPGASIAAAGAAAGASIMAAGAAASSAMSAGATATAPAAGAASAVGGVVGAVSDKSSKKDKKSKKALKTSKKKSKGCC